MIINSLKELDRLCADLFGKEDWYYVKKYLDFKEANRDKILNFNFIESFLAKKITSNIF